MSDYLPELDTAMEYFFDTVILPGDSLIVITPMKTYRLRSEDFAGIPKSRTKDELLGKLRKDILLGSSEYRKLIRELETALLGDESLEEKIEIYSSYSARLESLRNVDEKSLVQFADFLKRSPGQKYVYLFYQKERVPKIDWKELMRIMSTNQDNFGLIIRLMDLFQHFSRDVGFNTAAVKKAYADSSIAVHFLFLTKTPATDLEIESLRPSGMAMTEQSEDIFSAFNEVAAATGGISDSSANAASAFQRAVSASENYYLVYYKPQDYKADGKFHELKVNVKAGNYRIAHRAGYIAK